MKTETRVYLETLSQVTEFIKLLHNEGMTAVIIRRDGNYVVEISII